MISAEMKFMSRTAKYTRKY